MGKVKGLSIINWIALIIIGGTLLGAIFAPMLTPYNPYDLSLTERLEPPGKSHLLGTDSFGRDILTQVLYGARVTLLIAVIVLGIGGGVGLVVGVVAGYFGGIVDGALMRLTDATLSFPIILLGLLFVATVGPGIMTVSIAISLVIWARFARIIRAEVLSLREVNFVTQAKINGCSSFYILRNHIIPHVFNTFWILISLQVGWVIIVEASLSFLGAGVPPPNPSWGMLASEGRNYINSAWWISLVPATAIVLVVLAFNLLGDWIRDSLDPELKHQLS